MKFHNSTERIYILNLVIPKPDIPKDIAQNYKQVKVQWTEQLVAKQQKITEEIKKETELLRAVADARRQKEVLEIKIQEQILETEGKQKISEINNQIVKEKENKLWFRTSDESEPLQIKQNDVSRQAYAVLLKKVD